MKILYEVQLDVGRIYVAADSMEVAVTFAQNEVNRTNTKRHAKGSEDEQEDSVIERIERIGDELAPGVWGNG